MEPLTDVFGTQTSAAAMAFGLRGVVDWSVQQPFLDVFKTARPWHGHTDAQWGAYMAEDLAALGVLDSNGWVTRMPPGVAQIQTFILTEMPVEATYTGGLYRLSYDGAGDITVFGAQIVSRAPGEIWFDYRPEGNGMVTISISATDPQNTGNHLRNISVVKQEHIPAYEAGQVFNPLWLDIIDDAHALRFMDWQETNDSPIRSWSERPTEGQYTYHGGVPLEVMVDLANATGTEPWFNIPWDADAAFIRQFATYVRDNLNPDLRAHFELSNEVWNWMFTQARDAASAAQVRFGRDLGDGWMQEYGARSAEMARILDSVYSGAEDRLVKVIATHTYWPGLEQSLLEAPAWQALGAGNSAPYLLFDTYAITGYFGNSLGTDEKAPAVLGWIAQSEAQARQEAASLGLTGAAAARHFAEHRFDLALDLAVRELRDGSVTGNPEDSLQGLFELFRYHKSVADAHGLDLVMYEGGTHVVGVGQWTDNDLLTEFFIHLNYSDGMGQLYAELLDGWEAAGGTLFNAFVDISEPTKWGSWGSLRHLEDSSARHDAVVDFMRENPAPAHMKDGTWASGPNDFGLVPGPLPAAPETDQQQPQPDLAPPPPGRVPAPAPQPEGPSRSGPIDDVREYVFGNDLFVWAIGNPEFSVAHWVDLMAEASGRSYAVGMQTGMLTLHDDLPPNPHISLPSVDEAWDPDTGQSFANARFNQITIAPANFVQDQAPDRPYWIDPTTSPVTSALRIIDWVSSRAPGATINIYETWPEIEGFAATFPPSPGEFAAWLSYMNGDWHDWWVTLTDRITDARPDLEVRLISVGPQIAAMLDTPSLGLGGLTVSDLFVDADMHGTPTLYFLAAMTHYTGVFGAAPPRDLNLPPSLHPDVIANFPAISDWLWQASDTALPAPIVNPFTEMSARLSDMPDISETTGPSGATDGDDRITVSPGDTFVDGRSGFDTSVFDVDQSSVTVRFARDSLLVEMRDGVAGTVTLRNIEQLDFRTEVAPFDADGLNVGMFDGMASLNAPSMAALTELYIAYFNRAPDAIGLFFWGDQLASGMSLDQIAAYFFDQPETQALYGDLDDLPSFVTAVYENVLGRAPDSVGMDFWLRGLQEEGTLAPSNFIQAIIAGAKADTGGLEDAAYLANKVSLGGHFAVTRGMSDLEAAIAVMQTFDGSDASLRSGIAQTDAIHADIVDGVSPGFLMQIVGMPQDAFAF